MSIDKKIDYVEQDGSLNFIKNSESVTVPKKFKARKEAPATKLAYITDAEAKMLKKMKKGTPHKGPKGIPSYDSFGSIDADTGKDTGMAGGDVSRAESGDFGPIGGGGGPQLPPGVDRKPTKEEQELRSAFIAAGAGQRVNPGFFDSRNTVSPDELAAAKAYNPTAFRKNRRGGIMDFITSGGFLGNMVRGIGQRFGLGKRYNEPTYDYRGFDSVNPTFQDDLDNELMLSTKATPSTLDLSKLEKGDLNNIASLINNAGQSQSDFEYLGPNFNEGIYMDYRELDDAYNNVGSKINSGTITPLEDDFPSEGIMSQVDDVPTDLEIFKKRFP